jgi:hypothetical protein
VSTRPIKELQVPRYSARDIHFSEAYVEGDLQPSDDGEFVKVEDLRKKMTRMVRTGILSADKMDRIFKLLCL